MCIMLIEDKLNHSEEGHKLSDGALDSNRTSTDYSNHKPMLVPLLKAVSSSALISTSWMGCV